MGHRIAIFGASGYTGAELVRLIAGHPGLEIAALGADRRAGQAMGEVFPHLGHLELPALARVEEMDLAGLDLVFCALPHTTSREVVARLPGDLRVVDLSADFRLRDPGVFEAWYGAPHGTPELQREAVYGLTEAYRDDIRTARLVAGTGCNAAAGQYALRPLIAEGLVDLDDIVIDLKTGVSGAGRSAKEHLLYAELSEGTQPYGAGGTHRHLAEFDQEFSALAGREVRVQFTPHLIPANRGILASVYVAGEADELHAALADTYAGEPFVQVLRPGAMPSTHHVRGANLVQVSVVADRRPGRAVIFAALDNLVKGAAGQAVQNANVMLGHTETAGLAGVPVFP